jgi:4-hydroxyphenylpyruvate dioxygenase
MAKHGDGIKTVALWVDDAKKAYETTISRGAQSYFSPISESDEHGLVTRAGIHTYGDTVHVFVERNNYQGIFLPRYKKIKARKMRTSKSDHDTGLLYVDHVVGNVETGQMNHWANFYTNVLGFKQLISFDDKDISTEYTALMSKVMCNDNLRIKFPINEPAPGKLVSQIQEFLDFYNGPGVQHLALTTNDIIATVKALKARGVDFLYVPASYYDTVLERCGAIEENLEELKENRILIDRDESGYLLQIFTKPLQERPTLFFEIIQRKGAKSFGKGNFKALFESIEREQKKRGTL